MMINAMMIKSHMLKVRGLPLLALSCSAHEDARPKRPTVTPARRHASAAGAGTSQARRAMPAPTDIGHGEDPRAALGRIVHRRRIALGISQEDLAERVGLDRTYVSGIERGIRDPTFLVLLRLAHALGIAAARFMEPEDDDPIR